MAVEFDGGGEGGGRLCRPVELGEGDASHVPGRGTSGIEFTGLATHLERFRRVVVAEQELEIL